jgi:hypothetical protein
VKIGADEIHAFVADSLMTTQLKGLLTRLSLSIADRCNPRQYGAKIFPQQEKMGGNIKKINLTARSQLHGPHTSNGRNMNDALESLWKVVVADNLKE